MVEEQKNSEIVQKDADETKRTFWKGMVLGIVLSCVICAIAVTVIFGKKQNVAVEADRLISDEVEAKLKGLAGIIQMYYYEDIEEADLIDGVYKGLLDGLNDPYSEYYTVDEYASLQESNEGTYQGIGAVLSQNKTTMEVSILNVYEGSPAEKAGLKSGDIIVSVDGIEAVSMQLNEFVTHIRGEEATSAHLVIKRDEKELEFDVERHAIEVPTVASQMLEDNVGYIQISEFTEVTAGQFENQVAELTKKGMKGMIVDLRNNPGGLVPSVVQILDDILPDGVVVYTQDKYGNRKDYTSEEDTKMNIPIAVLINGNSASASEIFAGAVRDFKYGTLIGTTSFGKGIVQTILPLDDGSAVKITTAKYYTPSGNYIHGVGIDPDIELEYEYMSEDKSNYDIKYDNQVQKALEIVKDKIK